MTQFAEHHDISNAPMGFSEAVRRAGAAVRTAAVSIFSGLSRFLTSMQVGRMETVLHRMSDEQLAQVGITRSGIKAHAKYLVTYEYDGL